MFLSRERQLKLEKVRATQQHIEEFRRQQAAWRRMEQEKMEAENRRIVEFASRQQQMEESRNAKIKEREDAKEHLHQIVKTTCSSACSVSDTCLQKTSLLCVLLQLSRQIETQRQQREELERVREELCFEEQEEANRQRGIVRIMSHI